MIRRRAASSLLGCVLVVLGCGCSAGTASRHDATSGSGGEAGSPGVGGAPASGGVTGATGGQASGGAGATTGGAGSGGTSAYPPIDECAGGSLDRLQLWLVSGEGQTVPSEPNTTLLVSSGEEYVGKIEFVGNEWHVVPVRVGNDYDAIVDLSASKGFELTYSATADFYVQLRPASHWSGGDKWVALVPSTGGQIQSVFFPFDAASWTTLPALGTPSYSVDEARSELRGLVFVGQTPNVIEFHGLRFDGYVPECNDSLPPI